MFKGSSYDNSWADLVYENLIWNVTFMLKVLQRHRSPKIIARQFI